MGVRSSIWKAEDTDTRVNASAEDRKKKPAGEGDKSKNPPYQGTRYHMLYYPICFITISDSPDGAYN